MASTQERPRDTAEEQQQQIGDGQPRGRDQQRLQQVPPARTQAPDEQEKTREEEEAAARTAQRKTRIKKVAPFVVILLVVGALLWWLHARKYEDTDDAQVDGHISQIGSRIAGYVTKVYVEDNQEVQQGQLLVEIDPRDYQVALARAQADYADSQATAKAANYNIPITSIATSSQIESAQADVNNAQAALSAAPRRRQRWPTPQKRKKMFSAINRWSSAT